jgi:hypothetical protein
MQPSASGALAVNDFTLRPTVSCSGDENEDLVHGQGADSRFMLNGGA